MIFSAEYIKVPTYKVVENYDDVTKVLDLFKLKPFIAFDLEIAPKQPTTIKKEAEAKFSKKVKDVTIEDYQNAYRDGRSSPKLTLPILLGAGISDKEAYIFVLSTKRVRNLVFNFLVETDILQIWHNSTFDFNHIVNATRKMPKRFKDTQLIAKTLINNVDSSVKTSLDFLMKKEYGDWKKDKVDFVKENARLPKMHQYLAIDVCATYKLWTKLWRVYEKRS